MKVNEVYREVKITHLLEYYAVAENDKIVEFTRTLLA